MNVTIVLAVALGGAVGAPLRMFIDGRVTGWVDQQRWSTRTSMFPWGLLAVNALGALVIGISFGAFEGVLRTLIATGVCGALTTYSAYALVIHRLWRENRAVAWASVIVMPVVCISLCSAAVLLTRALV